MSRSCAGDSFGGRPGRRIQEARAARLSLRPEAAADPAAGEKLVQAALEAAAGLAGVGGRFRWSPPTRRG